MIGLLVLILLLIIFAFLKIYPKISYNKGLVGERRVSKLLKTLNPSEYVVINDVLINSKDHKTSQIDHIIVSVYGIFVIETKHYSGWIFGNENAENWVQIFYKSRYRFRNPIKQNWSHIYALREVLTNFKNVKYFPIIVFTGKAVLKKIQSSISVIYINKLVDFVRTNSKEKILSSEEVSNIVLILKQRNVENEDIRIEHVDNIRNSISRDNLKKEKLICPKCNVPLKLRNGKYGKFFGCQNYPYCKFTMRY